MKKIFYFIMTLLLCLFSCNSVYAETAQISQNDIGYYYHAKDNGSYYSKYGQMFDYRVNGGTYNGKKAYCIAPAEVMNSYESYNIYKYNDSNLVNNVNSTQSRNTNYLTQEQLDEISYYAYYGYGYKNHTSTDYMLATQMLIYRVNENQVFTNANCALGSCYRINDPPGVASAMIEIKSLVNSHFTKPSFDGNSYEINIGDTLELTDEHGVLSNYRVETCNNCNASINGNTLSITSTNKENISISLSKGKDEHSNDVVFFTSSNSQNMVIAGNIDPVYTSLRLTVNSGSITVIKSDSSNSTKLSNAGFEVYNSSGTKVCSLITDSNGSATCGELPLGTYTVKEVKTSDNSYILNTNVETVTITSDNLNPTLNITNDKIKGYVEIYKLDSDTSTSTASGEATLKDAEYTIYDSNNNVIEKLKTNASGYAKSSLMYYGNYYILETTSPTGYKLDSTKYNFKIEQNDKIEKLTVKDEVIKGKVKVLKYDSETNSCSPKGNASLVGATFNVVDSKGNVVDTITTDNSCTALSKSLPYGSYYVIEIQAPTGYKLNSTKYNFNVSEDNTTKTITIKDDVIKGKVKITKYDSETNSCVASGEASLVGAVYNIYDSNNNIVDTITTNSSCTASSKDLPYGSYYILEKDVPKGYKLDTEKHTFNISENNSTVSLTLTDEVIKGKIKVSKYDNDTKICNPRGQASLQGAIFNIKDSKGNIVDTITTDSNCTAISKDLPYGNYKIEEKTASEGYYINSTIYSQNITEEKVYTSTILEKVIENYISILKQYEYIDGQTAFLNAEKDIVFEIFSTDGTKYTEIKTDKNGYATVNLPYGVWKFHQVNTSDGYEKIYDFNITVDSSSEKEQYYNILNNSLSAYLQVFKKDAETGETIKLANTTFKIYNEDTNEFVSQYVGGKVLSEFKTDEEGKFVTYLKLSSGNYKLIETSSPKGYLINSDGVKFTIGNDTHFSYTTYGAFITLEYENTPIKGIINVNKKGEIFCVDDNTYNYDKKIYLDGIKFNIYADEDIKSSDGNHIYYNKDDIVDELTTDSNGNAISKQLPLGKYRVVEIETKDDYILDTKVYHITLTEQDNRTPIVYSSITMTNKLKKGTLEFTKTDLVSGEVIPNTILEIYTQDNSLIYTGITDKNGKIRVDNLKAGKYYIKEKQSSTGYVITDEIVYFEIKENGEVVKANMKNKPITSTLEFTKTDLSTDEPLPNTLIEIYNDKETLVFSGKTNEEGKIIIEELRYGKYYILEKEAPEGYTLNEEKMYFEVLEDGQVIKSTMKDKKITGTLEFSKLDISTSAPLPNTLIEIYNTETDELIFSGRTDEEGNIKLENIEYGKYYILEKEAPEGYTLNEEKIYFEVKENGQIIKSIMTDEKIIEVPFTYKEDGKVFLICGIIYIIVGMGMIIYGRRKKK